MPMGRRLALFMDGTWNDPDSQTNVHKLSGLVAPHGADGKAQLSEYVVGVGVEWYERLRGGTFGFGLSRNVVRGYSWLVDQYQEGDEVFVFGFSRGAYTSRSVVGIIARCGLLRRVDTDLTTNQVYQRYRKGKSSHSLATLQWREKQGDSADFNVEDRALLRSSRRVPIRFVGVWDTVGALGIPTTRFWVPWGRQRYYFHELDLSIIVEEACHAVAIDEHRKDYSPSLWTSYTPDGEPPVRRAGVEQRWFAGAHSNVGGGYEGNRLSDLPLAWLAERASSAGLTLTHPVQLCGDEHLEIVVDAYEKFMGRFYRYVRNRHFRTIDYPARKVKGGTADTINETIDASVFERWRANLRPPYRAENLAAWAKAKGVNLASVRSAVSASTGEPV